MKTQAREKIQSFVQEYKDSEGNNPFVAAFQLTTFLKAIPLELFKAIAVALGGYLLINVAFYFLGAAWWLLLISIVGGLGLIIFLALTGSVNNIASAFINQVAALFLGILQPTDALYDHWQAATQENLSRKEFFSKVFREAIIPKIVGQLSRVPFKKRLQKYLERFVGNIGKEEKEEVGATPSADNFLKRKITQIDHAATLTKRGFQKPYYLTLKLAALFWGALLLLHFLLG
ncbi:MAG: hypothetical protein ACFB0B_06810 [Thermonemataceae bacterium]